MSNRPILDVRLSGASKLLNSSNCEAATRNSLYLAPAAQSTQLAIQSVANAAQDLGYEPQDDAERFRSGADGRD